MTKHMVFAFAFFMSVVAFGGSKATLLSYEYGNQIFGSSLQILDDGSVIHEERTCCAPHTDRVPERKLKKNQLQQLISMINEASTGSIKAKPCDGDLGEKFGVFTVMTPEAQAILIRSDVLSIQGSCVYSQNLSEAAGDLETFVYQYVQNRAP